MRHFIKLSVLITLILSLGLIACTKPGLPDEQALLKLCPGNKMTRVHSIQGTGHRSPMENKSVTCVTGIVTAISEEGFYLQDLIEDRDDRSSEAIFVAYTTMTGIKKGDRVFIKEATVQEYNPSINQSNSLTITRLIKPMVQIVSSGNEMPPALVLGEGGRAIPNQVIENDVIGYVGRDPGLFDPDEDGMDFFESIEGMFVEVHNALAVSSKNRFNELTVVADEGKNASVIADSGALVIRENDFNPERIILDDAFIQMPDILIASRFTAPIRGVISYDFGNYRLLPTERLVYEHSGFPVTTVAEPQNTHSLSVASYNIENLSSSDDPARFKQLAEHVVYGLGSPSILVLQEVLDNDGAINSQTVSADKTISLIIEAINNFGPKYTAINIDPERNADGGIKGGNGRVVILCREDSALSFSEIGQASARTEIEIQAENAVSILSHNPGRIWPQNSSFRNSRKALVAQFTYKGENIFVIGVHFSSKGEDGPLFGEIQPPPQPSENRRIAQAKAVNGFVKRILEAIPDANIIVLGDINDFYWTETVATLQGEYLKNTAMTLHERNRYTYIYEGNGQMMDQIFLSKALFEKMTSFQIAHLNTGLLELEAFSDHDPVIVYLNFD